MTVDPWNGIDFDGEVARVATSISMARDFGAGEAEIRRAIDAFAANATYVISTVHGAKVAREMTRRFIEAVDARVTTLQAAPISLRRH